MKRGIKTINIGKHAIIYFLAFFSIIYANATTYTVNSAADAGAGSSTSGDLRYCINQANATPGPHTINFNIAPSGAHTITLGSSLPNISRQINIDATTQPGYSGTPVITLTRSGSPGGWDGLFVVLQGSNSTFKGLCINNFRYGIFLNDADNCTIQSCFIGTNNTGTVAAPNNEHGIFLTLSQNNLIGGPNAADRNLVSGNSLSGIFMVNACHNNTVRGNYIGTNAAGTASIGNVNAGTFIHTSNGTTVRDNVISGNSTTGTYFYDSDNNTIRDNIIGLDATGSTAMGNGSSGIHLDINSDNNDVFDNIISANLSAGILLNLCDFNTITGNIIGLDATGTLARGNSWDGIILENSSDNNTIGGTTAALRNVCSGNMSGIAIKGSTGNNVLGNYTGVATDGTTAIPNSNFGIWVGVTAWGADPTVSNTIGGLGAGEGNIVAYNTNGGVMVEGANTESIVVRGNSIFCNGTNVKGIDHDGTGNNTIASPVMDPSSTTSNVFGTAVANSTVDLYYYDASCHDCGTGFVQGQTYVATVVADGSGNWSYTGGVSSLDITTTATDGSNNTSEFSECVTILPVSFLSFNVTATAQHTAICKWATTWEVNNAYFVVERSIDGSTFEAIGQVDGQGNSSQVAYYNFEDVNVPANNVVYYRIKQVDFDGQFSYSEVRSILFENTFSIYPNPTHGEVFIIGEADNIHVTNTLGQEVVFGVSGNAIDLSNLPAGAYFLTISNGNNRFVEKVVKK